MYPLFEGQIGIFLGVSSGVCIRGNGVRTWWLV